MKTFNEWLTEMGMDINVDKKPLSRLHRKPSDDVPPEDDMGDDEDGEEGDDDIDADAPDEEDEPDGDEGDDMGDEDGDKDGDEPPPPIKKKKFDFSSLGKV